MHLFFKFHLGQGKNVIQYKGPPLNSGSLAIVYKIGTISIELETLLSIYRFVLKDLMQLFLKFHQMWIDGIGLTNFAPNYGQVKKDLESIHNILL